MEYTIFDKKTGACFRGYSGHIPNKQLRNNESFVEGHYPEDTYYIDLTSGDPTEKPQIQPELNKTEVKADGQDSIVISGLPTDDLNGNTIDTIVRVDSGKYPVPDGELEFTVDAPGEYKINIRATNHKPYRTTIQAYDDED